jgi:acetoacetyl-CoA synthetase
VRNCADRDDLARSLRTAPTSVIPPFDLKDAGPPMTNSAMTSFRDQVKITRGLAFSDYEALHRWSVEDPAFWEELWRFDGIESPTPYTAVLAEDRMPGAVWFPGAQVNYARHMLRHVEAAEAADQPAVIAEDELGPIGTLSWLALRRQVASLALEMRALGVEPGDRIAAYLPNRPEAVVAFLACAAIGAVWSICAPDMGVPAILDRFRQIEPRLLIATDGVTYAGKTQDLAATVREIRQALPSVRHLLLVDSGKSSDTIPEAISFAQVIGRSDDEVASFEPRWVSFDHPLWIVYSSGTTGKPKGLVHSHGGILLSAAASRLHTDMAASYDARKPTERFHWFSSTGWMMWNVQVGGLLGGATICIYDGSPSGAKAAPDFGVLWRFAARHRVSIFGAGAPFYTACVKADLDLRTVGDLSALRVLGSTAAPLPAAVQVTMSAQLEAAGYPGAWWYNSSGGTDICGAFCTGNAELPAAPGKLQCRQLGAAVEAWDEDGSPLVGEVGELVCLRPLPSMPIYLWGDADGSRYRSAYFETYPGVWRHGDWLKIDADGVCEIFGRSDATINRGGHRMGTSEIYDAVEALAEIQDSLAIDVRGAEGDSKLILFVVATEPDDEALQAAVRAAIRRSLSPRFTPDRIIRVAEIPRTLSGKKQELPAKRLFEGARLADVVDLSAMVNPGSMREMARLADDFRREAEPA